MNNLYDVLEVCLQEVDNGMDLESILSRYSDLAEELRPILQASIAAQKMAIPAPSAEVVRRNRSKLLQYAAQIREVQSAPRTSWFSSFQRLAVALAFVLLFFVSGTGLVRAASSALPGDGLYSVKRSWEDVTLFFSFNAQAHQALELEYEGERLDEINGLFASGRIAKVDFTGIVTRQNGDGWRIANILVIVSKQTTLPDQAVEVGAALRVTGITKGDGIVLAEQIELLPSDAAVPPAPDDKPEIETEQPQVTPQPDHGTPNSGVGTEAPEIEATNTPAPESEGTATPLTTSTPKVESFESVLSSINKDVWTINGVVVDVANAEIKGTPVIGGTVKVEGYYNSDGIFVAIKIEFINNGSNTNNNSGGNANINDNSSNVNSGTSNNTNTGSDTNSNTNSNTNSGGGSGNSNDDNGGGGGGGKNGNGG